MLNIYFFENNKQESRNLISSINNFIMMEELPLRIVLQTDSLMTLSHKIRGQNLFHDIFLFDIDISNYLPNCINLAQFIRKNSPTAKIGFITGHTDIAFSIVTHGIEPFDIIDKNLNQKDKICRVKKDLKKIVEQFNCVRLNMNNLFSYVNNNQIFSFPLRNLIYIQTVSGKRGLLELHSTNKVIFLNGILRHFELKYPILFRSQKGILLNPVHIRRFDLNTRYVFMDNGDKLEVSFRKISILKKLLLLPNSTIEQKN